MLGEPEQVANGPQGHSTAAHDTVPYTLGTAVATSAGPPLTSFHDRGRGADAARAGGVVPRRHAKEEGRVMINRDTTSARLLAVGDVYFDRTEIRSPYAALGPLLTDADFRFCNYEAPITSAQQPVPGPGVRLRTPPENLRALEAGRFDAISLANNHILDYGVGALKETLDTLEGRRMPFTGAGNTLYQALRPIVLERRGIRFGFLAFACAFPPGYAASASQPGLAPVRIQPEGVFDIELQADRSAVTPAAVDADVALMSSTVSELKRDVDHVIVSYHWGVPGNREPEAYQRALGHATIDAGASVVLGHHAHVLQPVEAYGRGLILYGLSHFIFDLPEIISRFGFDTETAAVSIDFARDEIQGASLTPMVMEEGADPRPPLGVEAERIFGLLRELSAPLGTALQWDADRGSVQVRL